MEEYDIIFFPSFTIHKHSVDSSNELHGCRWCPALSHLHFRNIAIKTSWSVFLRAVFSAKKKPSFSCGCDSSE